jgi:hypothetical protein
MSIVKARRIVLIVGETLWNPNSDPSERKKLWKVLNTGSTEPNTID